MTAERIQSSATAKRRRLHGTALERLAARSERRQPPAASGSMSQIVDRTSRPIDSAGANGTRSEHVPPAGSRKTISPTGTASTSGGRDVPRRLVRRLEPGDRLTPAPARPSAATAARARRPALGPRRSTTQTSSLTARQPASISPTSRLDFPVPRASADDVAPPVGRDGRACVQDERRLALEQHGMAIRRHQLQRPVSSPPGRSPGARRRPDRGLRVAGLEEDVHRRRRWISRWS